MRVCIVFALAALAAADTFFVIGDWGGQDLSPYTTQAEVDIAGTLAAQVTATQSSFALALGDNFYTFGVSSVNDPRFKETFEDVFSGASLQGPAFKFYVLAGNHDHYGNATAQVAYSGQSNRWTFPSLYYTFTKTTADGATIQFVMIDTVVLTGNSPTNRVLHGNELPGPAEPVTADNQLTWITETLKASTADYLIVAGHYPVWSVCEHGPTSMLVDQLKPLLEQYKVTAYLAGHDHCAEYLNEGTGVQYHGIGAAHGVDDSLAHLSAVPAGSLKWHWAPIAGAVGDDFDGGIGAFASISVTKQAFQVTHLSDNGTLIYTAPAVKPRTSSLLMA